MIGLAGDVLNTFSNTAGSRFYQIHNLFYNSDTGKMELVKARLHGSPGAYGLTGFHVLLAGGIVAVICEFLVSVLIISRRYSVLHLKLAETEVSIVQSTT